MKRILIVIFTGAICTSAHAACPNGFTEIQMENTVLSETSCAAGQASYYHIDEMCTGNLY